MQPTNYLKFVGIDITKKGHNSYKLEAEGFMPLTVETWHQDNKIFVSMCHYGEMNGDLMKDPDVLFMVQGQRHIKYLEMQNDYTAFYTENHEEIKDFVENLWTGNLTQQGHKLTVSA